MDNRFRRLASPPAFNAQGEQLSLTPGGGRLLRNRARSCPNHSVRGGSGVPKVNPMVSSAGWTTRAEHGDEPSTVSNLVLLLWSAALPAACAFQTIEISPSLHFVVHG